jgi:hypothetical protein
LTSYDNTFIKVGSFKDNLQASMAKQLFEANGISCVIVGDEFKIFQSGSDSDSLIQLLINKNQVNTAEEVLSIYFSDTKIDEKEIT